MSDTYRDEIACDLTDRDRVAAMYVQGLLLKTYSHDHDFATLNKPSGQSERFRLATFREGHSSSRQVSHVSLNNLQQ